jgi:pimeloyl-ACP methyl ester carboxylesterase
MKRSIRIPGNVEIKVDDEGTGPSVVFIHGWPVTNYHWRKIRKDILDSGFRSIQITPRGLGDASGISDKYEKVHIAHEIVDVLRILKIKEYAIVGHDWGGTIGYFICKDVGGHDNQPLLAQIGSA